MGVRFVSPCVHPVCFLHPFFLFCFWTKWLFLQVLWARSSFSGRMVSLACSDHDTQRKKFRCVIGKSVISFFVLLFLNISSRSEPQNSSSLVPSTLILSQISGAAGVGELGFRQFLHHSYHLNAHAVVDDGSCFFLHLESWHVAFYFILWNRLGLRQVFLKHLHSFFSGRNIRFHLTLSVLHLKSHLLSLFFPFFSAFLMFVCRLTRTMTILSSVFSCLLSSLSDRFVTFTETNQQIIWLEFCQKKNQTKDFLCFTINNTLWALPFSFFCPFSLIWWPFYWPSRRGGMTTLRSSWTRSALIEIRFVVITKRIDTPSWFDFRHRKYLALFCV